jgi:hypothetical protein
MKNWIWYVLGIWVFLSWKTPNEINPMDCVSLKKSSVGVTYWNVCEFPVSVHYCTSINMDDLFGREPRCQTRAVDAGGLVATQRLADENSSIFATATSQMIDDIMVCKSPQTPKRTNSRSFVCE